MKQSYEKTTYPLMNTNKNSDLPPQETKRRKEMSESNTHNNFSSECYNDPPIIYPLSENPVCVHCKQSIDIDTLLLQQFHIYICRVCKSEQADLFSLLTKTEAKEVYLLTDSDLKDIPFIHRPNPRSPNWHPMNLYLKYQVLDMVKEKWGGLDAVQEEKEKRLNKALQVKENKFKGKLKELRIKTRIENQMLKSSLKSSHTHEYSIIKDSSSGKATGKTCTGCGLTIQFEEL